MSTQGERTHRRRFARANVDFPVAVVLSEREPAIEGTAIDISAGGMRVATVDDLPAGQGVVLRFTLPEGRAEIVVHGKIVMSFYDGARGRYAHGIVFTQYAQPDQDAIVAFVASTGAKSD